jgi:hypothetical protein
VRNDDANVLVFTDDAGTDTVLGGGGGVIGGGWSFSTTITDADPGSGNFRLDNATQGSATQIFISNIAANGLNASGILLALSSGDKIYLQESADPTRFHEANVTGTPTNATTYVKIPITMLDSGADLRNNRSSFVVLVGTGGAGGGGLPVLDTTIIVQDDADITRQMRFEAGSIPNSTTIVLTLPAASKTLDGVGDSRPPTAHTHTLTDITDSGALAALNTITLAEVTDSGALAALNTITLTEVTDSGALAALNTVGTAEIDDDAVTLAKIQNIDTDRFLGRTTAASGIVEQLTPTQATAMLDVFASGTQGVVPASGGTATDYLGGDGTWGAVDHGGLAGNADDDHTQYALLAGRAGGQTLAGSDTATEGLTLRANLGALDGSISVTTTTAAVSAITGALTVAGGVGISGDVYIGSDLDIAGKLTVAGLIDPTGMQFDVQTSNPGNANTLWIRQADGALMHGNDPVSGGGGGGGGAIVEGTNPGQLTYWDEGQQLWLPALGLDWDDTTQIFRIGAGIGSSASPEPNASFTVDAITGDVNVGGGLSVDGKLTVAGLIDPSGMVFDEQATVPGGAPGAAKGTLWVRNDTPNVLIFTDDVGSDVQLGAPIADHGLLTGLADDDHSQYFMVANTRGVGQVVTDTVGPTSTAWAFIASPSGTGNGSIGMAVTSDSTAIDGDAMHTVTSVTVNDTNASNGRRYGTVYSLTGSFTTPRANGMLFTGGMGVLEQISDPTGTLSFATAFKENGGFTDVTAAFASGATDVTIFDGNNDYIYVGHTATFSGIAVGLNIDASSDRQLTFEYSDGVGGWNFFTPIDTTNGCQNSGVITWRNAARLTGWATDTVNAVSGRFWVRIRRTNAVGGTTPTEEFIFGIPETSIFSWDHLGDLTINSVQANDGTLSAPAYQFAGNSQTGWFLDTADVNSQVELNQIVDANGTIAYELGTAVSPLRQLVDGSGFTSVNVDSRELLDSSGNSLVQWSSTWLLDTTGSQSVDWGSRYLQDSSSNITVDWGGMSLYDTSFVQSIDWSSRYLLNFSGSTVAEWGSSDGFYISSSAVGALAMDQISAPGGPLGANGGQIYFDSIGGHLMVHFAGGSAVQIAAYA